MPAVNNAASIYSYMGQQNLNSMFINPVNEDDVIRIIELCKPKDSMGHDDIRMWVLSRIAPHVAKPLGHIFNLSLSTDIIPSELNIAKVIPLFKNGNNLDFSNYRPISLVSQFSKVLDRLFNERLQQFLSTNNILSNSQYGYRAHMSTVHAALELTESIYNSIDSKNIVLEFSLTSKRHLIPLIKTISLKIIILCGKRDRKYMVSKLMNRKQYVVVVNQASSMQFIKCGVPQGSDLGPVLFLLFINDM